MVLESWYEEILSQGGLIAKVINGKDPQMITYLVIINI